MNTIILTNADKVADLIKHFREDIKKEIIPSGLDEVLSQSLEELKNDLLHLINNEIRYIRESDSPNEELPINIASSDKTILKYFGFDLDSVKLNSYSIDSYDAKIKFIQDYSRPNEEDNLHCRVQIPASPDESIEQLYNKAIKNFQDSLYVDNNSGITKYYILTDKGKQALQNYVKIFCSTYTGIQDGPALLKAQHRRNLEIKKGLNYSFWAIKQDGLKQLLDIKNGFAAEITDIIGMVKEGKAKEALNILKIHQGEEIEEFKNKISNFSEKKNLTPDTKGYSDLIELINNLKLSKKLTNNSIIYTLVSNLNQEDIGLNSIFFQLKEKINTWKIINENIWINKLIELIVNLIKKYLE